MMEENQPPRFHFRLRTLLITIVLLALLLVVIIQQVQIGRMNSQIQVMKQTIDAATKDRQKLTTIIREQRDHIERHK